MMEDFARWPEPRPIVPEPIRMRMKAVLFQVIQTATHVAKIHQLFITGQDFVRYSPDIDVGPLYEGVVDIHHDTNSYASPNRNAILVAVNLKNLSQQNSHFLSYNFIHGM